MLRLIAVTLMLVELVKGSSAADVSAYSSPVQGFTYLRNTIPRMNINAPEGTFQNCHYVRNTTAWRPKFAKGFTEIAQTVTFPGTSVRYPDTSAKVGLLYKVGPVVSNLDKSSYRLTLSASGNSSAGSNSSCELDFQVEVSCLEIDLNLRGLGLVGFAIRTAYEAYKELKQRVAESLRDELSYILPECVSLDLSRRIKLDELCKQLLASNNTNYPQPLFH